MEFAEILEEVVEILAYVFSCIGIFVIVFGGVKVFVQYIGQKLSPHVHSLKMELAESMAFALEFMMVGEILHTIVAKSTTDLIVLGAIVVLRTILTLVIHYEIKFDLVNDVEEEEHEEK